MPVDRRTFVRGAGGLAAASALAGCLGDDETSVTLWHGLAAGESESIDRQVAAFVEETGRLVDAERVEELEEQLETTVPLGQGPELFGWAHDWMGDFEERGFVYDADEALSVDLPATFLDPAVEAARFDGKAFGLPYAAETTALLYNETLVDRPPSTVEELVEAIERSDADHGLAAPVDPWTISAWLHAGGGFYYDDDSETVGVADAATVEALEFYRDTLWPHQPDGTGYDDQVEPFRDGNAPFAIDGPWALNLDGANLDAEDVDVAPLPTAEIGTPSPYVGVQLWYFSSVLDPQAEGETGLIDFDRIIPGNGEDREELLDLAVEFVEWYTTNPEIVRDNASEHLFVPVLESVAAEIDEHPVDAFVDSVRAGRATPQRPAMREVWRPLADAIDDVLAGGADAETALEAARETIHDAIEERDGTGG